MDIRVSLHEVVRSFERDLLLAALRATRGNQKAAARVSRVTYRQLRYLIKKHGVGPRTIDSYRQVEDES